MKCPYCHTGVRVEFTSFSYPQKKYNGEIRLGISIDHGFCPECENIIVLFREGEYVWFEDQEEIRNVNKEILLFPKLPNRIRDTKIPSHYRNAFNEASVVLDVSPKASAALSRRLLQKILHNEYAIQERNLYLEIDKFINLNEIPTYISESVDAVRVIGNFAAHPNKYETTGEIVDVEPGEAEWILEVLENLLEIIFVQPQVEQERINRLNKKLRALGRPQINS